MVQLRAAASITTVHVIVKAPWVVDYRHYCRRGRVEIQIQHEVKPSAIDDLKTLPRIPYSRKFSWERIFTNLMNGRPLVKVFFVKSEYCRCGQLGFSKSRIFSPQNHTSKISPIKISRYTVCITT